MYFKIGVAAADLLVKYAPDDATHLFINISLTYTTEVLFTYSQVSQAAASRTDLQ